MSLTDTTGLNNGVSMPWVGLGVYKMESGDEVVHAVRSALDLGYRHLDTASFYDNEEGVGQAIKESDLPREELFITTKVWNDEQGYEETLEAFDRSLRKLGLDYLDLYLIHWPIEGMYKATWKALEQLYKQGKVKAIGVSNFMTHHLDDLLKDAEVKPMVNQIEFHPELYQEEIVDYCKQRDIQVEAWSPIGRGTYLDNPILQDLAQKYKKTSAQIILRWDLQHGIVTIPKSTRKVRQQENADLFDFELTADEMGKINSLNKNNRLGPHPDEMGK
ncbi:aldo/keto reductase [Halobacillus naozhouensis]|uniref:Aldo/keto reductase n=1 Tax=Halobacillus naozhouensis TaxID=554880 RepID=A0ABY8J0F9_9BACI|nr:aldo/keto reductase [Halobacillus naozhouensis]WFT75974.1 aldo/keto reductase [Halobacillus naozhouensis]